MEGFVISDWNDLCNELHRTYSASKNQSSVLNILIVLEITQEPERIRTYITRLV
jgi:hypothetical protein